MKTVVNNLDELRTYIEQQRRQKRHESFVDRFYVKDEEVATASLDQKAETYEEYCEKLRLWKKANPGWLAPEEPLMEREWDLLYGNWKVVTS